MKREVMMLALVLAICLAGCSLGKKEAALSAPIITTTVPLPSTAPADKPADTTLPDSTVIPVTTPEPSFEHTMGNPALSQPPEIILPEPKDADFVRVLDYIPDLVVDLRYATQNNFTHQRIYTFNELWLRYGTVKKLMAVQAELKESGLSLKVWDGFRPPLAQFSLWNACPDSKYVSNPNKGFSSHSRGNTVDITLVDTDGTELVMPSGFDEFSAMADRDYRDCSPEAASNAMYLEQLMLRHGFKLYSGEWWHFSDTESYPVEQDFEPVAAAWYYADCHAFISLRTQPSLSAQVITTIPADKALQLLALHGDFALVSYRGLVGYVLSSYMRPVE